MIGKDCFINFFKSVSFFDYLAAVIDHLVEK